MFLLEVIDLLALVGLFVQTFVGWIFVAVLASIGRREPAAGGYRHFRFAFVALALALTVMSYRFLRAHDVPASYDRWADGEPLPIACYAVYLGLKVLFGILLVQGSFELAGRAVPTALRRLRLPLTLGVGALPLVFRRVDDVLLLQAPVLVACALLSAVVLRRLHPRGSGLRIVLGSLFALAASWTVHGATVVASHWVSLRPVLSFNSLVDMGVQLMLGIGLVVSLLETAHARLLAAEQERERLRRAMEKNEKLRALGAVVSGVAHELNNPLTVITGYAELLREESPSSAQAAIIVEQADRCRGIVRNLSALAGQSVHPRQHLDVEELAQRVVRGLSSESTRDGRRVRVAPMRGLSILADRVGLEQTLANLVLNGLQASPAQGEVVVDARALDEQVELRVTDSGPGVPPELRERLFEPFFTTKPPGKGTGLGLSIAHAIVTGHGGSITVDDGPSGRGATFRIVLPRSRPPLGAEPVIDGPQVADRLLVIDDDDAVRAVVREQAQRRGWQVVEAPSAEAALALPLAEVGAILCDLRMPGIGGVGFHDRLAAERPELLERVVFVTGDLASPGSAHFQERCERPLLHKPFDYDALFRQLGAAVVRATSDAALG